MKSWWYKHGPGASTPWALRKNGKIVDYNQTFLDEVRAEYGFLNESDYDDQDIIKMVDDPAFLKESQKKKDSKPWADFVFQDGKLVVRSYNKAFVDDLRIKFGDLVNENSTDDEIVALYTDRENLANEEPRLEVLHLGIEPDGQLKIKLDWNKSFIDHLRKHGITGETEDEAIKEYLSRLSTETADAQGEISDVITRDQLNEAFHEIDKAAERELDEAAAVIKKRRRRTTS